MDKTPVDARITLIHPRVIVAGDMRLAGFADGILVDFEIYGEIPEMDGD